MVDFVGAVTKTKQVIGKWKHFKDANAVTIIRDVYGKIAVLFDLKNTISDDDKKDIQEHIAKELGGYFQGRIYYKSDCQNDILRVMVDEIEQLRIPEYGEEKWYVLERAVGKKAWIDCNLEENAIWPYEQAVKGEKPKVVTFYSFKGGMGRTTALAATALGLIKQGKNVLMIDTDVEAPGLASLFVDENNVRKGVVDYLLEYNLSYESISVEDYLLQITDPILTDELLGKLFLISSGVIDRNYLQKLARIDFQDTIPRSLKMRICQLIADAVARISQFCKVDYILLDARAGFHDMGGIVTTQIPHGVVVFGKDTKQSWQGVRLVVEAISSVQKDRPLLAVVDSSCGQNGIISVEEKRDFTRSSYMICSETYYRDDVYQPGIEAEGEAHSPIFIPYQPALSTGVQLYSEGALQQNEKLEQIKALLMGKEYQHITNRILQWFSEGVQIDG